MTPLAFFLLELSGPRTAACRTASHLVRALSRLEDACTLTPGLCRGNLGVPRAEMPQIPDSSIPDLLGSEDPVDRLKGQAARASGGDPEDPRPFTEVFLQFLRDRGVTVSLETVEVGSLRATQRELKAPKIQKIVESYRAGDFDPREAPFFVSSDSHILDGHHRWAALIQEDPGLELEVTRIDLPMVELLEVAHQMPGVFRMDADDRVIASARRVAVASLNLQRL